MSKRLTTEFNFEPQFKKHVGEEDVEYTFNKQSVYDKTLEILFKAARLNPSVQTLNKLVASKNVDPENNLEQKPILKQLLLNNKCKLENKVNMLENEEYHRSSTDQKCSFCERLGCFTSLIQCERCEDYFCNNCSFFLYMSPEEISLCKSCFK